MGFYAQTSLKKRVSALTSFIDFLPASNEEPDHCCCGFLQLLVHLNLFEIKNLFFDNNHAVKVGSMHHVRPAADQS